MDQTIAYGWCREEAELTALGARRVYIDFNRERPRLADMLQPGALRNGDTLVLMAESDLGVGRALAKRRRLIAERGATIDVRGPNEPSKIGGRPSKLTPDEKQDAELAALMADDTRTIAYWERKASEIMGHPVKYAQLYYRYVTKPARQAAE